MTHVIGTHGNVEIARSTFRRARLQRPQTEQGADGGAPAVGWTAGEPDVRRELKLPPAEAAVLSNGACGLQHT